MKFHHMSKAHWLILPLLLYGVIDSSCTKEEVCRDGYTRSVRPPASYTDKLKAKQLSAMGRDDVGSYEEDHFIPLELCGCATCPKNLWPEPWPEARKKDVDETRLHRAVCSGQMSLEEGQIYIREHWTIHGDQ